MVKVLWWEYHDKSGMKIVRVYAEPTKAQQDFEMIIENSHDRLWHLDDVEFISAQDTFLSLFETRKT